MKYLKRLHPMTFLFDFIVYFFALFSMAIIVFPLLNTVALSFNSGPDAESGGIYFWPRVFTLDNYTNVLSSMAFFTASIVTVARTVLGTVLALILTAMFSYSLSKPNLALRRLYLILILVPMYFNGGVIPNFILMKSLGLLDNFFVYILPMLFSTFNALIFMSFFKSIPASLEESALIEGADYPYVFFKIIIPVSKPVLAAIALFIAVGHWNAWADTLLYVKNSELYTLSFYFREIVQAQQYLQMMILQSGDPAQIEAFKSAQTVTGMTLQNAAMIVALFPIAVVYPFLQKYFVKGVMIGAVKG